MCACACARVRILCVRLCVCERPAVEVGTWKIELDQGPLACPLQGRGERGGGEEERKGEGEGEKKGK